MSKHPNDSASTIDDGAPLISSTFLEFCAKVRNNDPSILPESGKPFKIRYLGEKEDMELADALLENTNVTYLELSTAGYTKGPAEAMAKYMRARKSLRCIRWPSNMMLDPRVLKQREETLCCFLPVFQKSTSLKELLIELPCRDGPSDRAFENMLTHTQSLRSLSLRIFTGPNAVAAAVSGLKKNTTLRELTLEFSRSATSVSPILTSLRDHPLLQRLCLCGGTVDLAGLETLLLSDTSKITELDICILSGSPPTTGLTHVLRALARRPTLTKLGLHGCRLGRDEARLLGVVLCNAQSLHTLVLTESTLGSRRSAGLAELAPALYRNTSIKELDLSNNGLDDMESSEILRNILCNNKTITTLDFSGNEFGTMPGAVECIVEGLGSNSTLLKIDLSSCAFGDIGISILAQTLASQNTTLQKLTLHSNSITSTGVRVLLEALEQNSCHITELDLDQNTIGNEGAILLARSLVNNALPNLTRLSLYNCGIDEDGFIALVSALEQNTSLLHLNLRHYSPISGKRAFLALAESLPKIKVLQRVDLRWCTGLASAMPLLLEGLRKNTSLFRFHVAGCALDLVPPSTEDTVMARCAGGWMQEVERLEYRNRFRPLIRRAPKEGLAPRGVWPCALAQVAILPDVIFEVLRSKPSLVPSEETEGRKEAAEDTGGVPRRNANANTVAGESS